MEMLFEELIKNNGSQLFHLEKSVVFAPVLNMQSDVIQIFEQLAEDTSWSFENSSRKDIT
jgi:hypothetical protein